MFADYKTEVSRTAKAWDSPRTGTVPLLLKRIEGEMQGYVQVYTGDGKGKTTAALGLALRSIGAGFKVYIA